MGLYCVWASIRAGEMGDGLRRDGVLPPAGFAGAELRAAGLALALDLADDQMAGFAVNW